MPVIQTETSVAAGAQNNNLFAGSAFEFASRARIVSVAVVSDITGTFVTIQSGAEVVLEESPPLVKTTFPIIPDEFMYTDAQAPQDRLLIKVRNPTAGAAVFRAIAQLTDL